MFEMKKLGKENLYLLQDFFKDIRFHMAKTATQGYMGDVYVDNLEKPNFSFAMFGKFLYIDGNPNSEFAEESLKQIKDFWIIITKENWFELIEKVFASDIEQDTRYSIKKDTKFNKSLLETFAQKLDKKYTIRRIDKELYERILETDSFVTNLKMSDEYEKYGMGYCAFDNNDNIIGVVTSNAIYKDSIEINIKVDENERRKGVATAIASRLILECLEKNIYPSWDAANLASVGLAKKLGYELDSEYRIYKVNKGLLNENDRNR